MKTLTINDLYKELAKQIKMGNKDKKILISNDDEGNGFHSMFYAVTPTTDFTFLGGDLPYSVSEEDAKENYVIIG